MVILPINNLLKNHTTGMVNARSYGLFKQTQDFDN